MHKTFMNFGLLQVHMTPEARQQLLKDRAKKLRHLRKNYKAKESIDQTAQIKQVVETNEYGVPNGRGRRELVHFLSVKTLSSVPTGIIESREVTNRTLDVIEQEARAAFIGTWTKDWAYEKMRATLRQRKCKTVKHFRDSEAKKGLQKALTTERFKVVDKLARSPNFLTKSQRLKATRGEVKQMSHCGRGGYTQIRIRDVSLLNPSFW
jgi:hypothetical protein